MESMQIQGSQGQLSVTASGVGAGLPILLLHSDSGRATQWNQVIPKLSAGHKVIALDFRGHGSSAVAADGDYSYLGRADDIGAVVDKMGWHSCVIVSHSASAGAALAYAARESGRVAGILMVDPPTDPRAMPPAVRDKYVRDLQGPASLDAQQAYFKSIAGSRDAVVREVLADAAAVAAPARLGVAEATAAWNPEAALHAFRGPMLVLSTKASDNQNALYRLRADIPHRVVPDSGHWIQLDHPQLVANAINDFVAGLRSKR